MLFRKNSGNRSVNYETCAAMQKATIRLNFQDTGRLCTMQIQRLLTSRILRSSGPMQKIFYTLVSGMVGLVGMEMSGENYK